MASPDPSGDTRDRFRAEELSAFTQAVLETCGVPPADAAIAAEVLIDADLSGIESHGIAHLPWHPGYAPGLKRGIVNPTPSITVMRESPVSAAWDGDGGMGVVVCPKAMEVCIAKAEEAGIGMVTVTNGRHFGAAGYYARIAAERDLIGMAYCNVLPLAVPAGGLAIFTAGGVGAKKYVDQEPGSWTSRPSGVAPFARARVDLFVSWQLCDLWSL